MFLLHRFPREEVTRWFRVLGLVVMGCVCRHTERKSRSRRRCAQTPSSNASHKTSSEPFLCECDDKSQAEYINKQILKEVFCIVECIVETFVHTVY